MAAYIRHAGSAVVRSAHDDEVGAPLLGDCEEDVEWVASVSRGARGGHACLSGEVGEVIERLFGVVGWFAYGYEVEIGVLDLGKFDRVGRGHHGRRGVVYSDEDSGHHGEVPL